MSKGGGDTTTVQKADPWSGVQPALLDLYDRALKESKQTLPFYPGQTYAGFDPLQLQGQNYALQYAQGLPSQIGEYQKSLTGMLNAPENIATNPAVQNMMAANRQQVSDTFTRNLLPSIDRGALAAGQYGGSRQGIAQGLAAGEAEKALANANAQTMLGAYGTASGLAGQAAGLMPGALTLGYQPAQTFQNIGAQQQGMTQQGINEAMQRYMYPQTSGRESLSWLNNILTGATPYASQSTTGPGPNKAANAFGTGLLGYQLGTNLLGSALGGGIGGGLGYVLGLSDRRAKKNIVPIGELNGYEWYKFEYKEPDKYGHGIQIGVMADEVQKIKPEAVIERPDGYLMVNYSKL